ncbi:hypothetical protein [Sphingomonas cavernae]|uniref:ACT domain-containing protein n=1 Tax=Sphingomonas cavernae TaxID=2320861 RepID=A0A418W741_9SPHN|nr:hypothetical protein [Sphingomonas cavernae]RJF85865.1 hypothetical protein D3876_18585 [Sphingomonas cavernae]
MSPASRAHFAIRAAADPQTVPRLLNYFAQLGLVPAAIAMQANEDGLAVEITQHHLPLANAHIIAEKMRASCLVETVSLAFSA